MGAEVLDLRLTTGIRVPCLVHGDADAKPLLLLHAWGESRRSFDRLVPLLTDFRVYAPDLRGQGDAEKPELGYSLAEQAEDSAAMKVYPGVGHLVLWECPDQVAADATAFLSSLD